MPLIKKKTGGHRDGRITFRSAANHRPHNKVLIFQWSMRTHAYAHTCVSLMHPTLSVLAIREHPRRALSFKGGGPAARDRVNGPDGYSPSGPMAEFTWVQTLLLSRLVRRNDRLAICASSHTTAGQLRQFSSTLSPPAPPPPLSPHLFSLYHPRPFSLASSFLLSFIPVCITVCCAFARRPRDAPK